MPVQFSSRLLRVYAAVLICQLIIVGLSAVNVATTATTALARLYTDRVNQSLKTVSFVIAQTYALKVLAPSCAALSRHSPFAQRCMFMQLTARLLPAPTHAPYLAPKVAVFDAANLTFSDFFAGKAARLSYAAAGCWVAYFLGGILAVVLAVSATSQDIQEHSASMVLFDLMHRGPMMINWPFSCMWIVAMVRLGISLAHFIDYDKAERKRAERLKLKLQGLSTDLSTVSALEA